MSSLSNHFLFTLKNKTFRTNLGMAKSMRTGVKMEYFPESSYGTFCTRQTPSDLLPFMFVEREKFSCLGVYLSGEMRPLVNN